MLTHLRATGMGVLSFVNRCVCACAHKCVYMCMWVCLQLCAFLDQGSTSGVLLDGCSLLYVLRQGLSLNLWLSNLARLAG